jgi:hypothetical protein
MTSKRRGGASVGATIASVMHGVDADIFRDPAAEQRIEQPRTPDYRTSDGTLVRIDVPERANQPATTPREDAVVQPPEPERGST